MSNNPLFITDIVGDENEEPITSKERSDKIILKKKKKKKKKKKRKRRKPDGNKQGNVIVCTLPLNVFLGVALFIFSLLLQSLGVIGILFIVNAGAGGSNSNCPGTEKICSCS
jgi:hypothetical protein